MRGCSSFGFARRRGCGRLGNLGCFRLGATRRFVLRKFSTAQIQHELFVRSFKSSALVVVGLNALFQALDRVILGCQTTRVVDSALGIVSILSLQRPELGPFNRAFSERKVCVSRWHSSILDLGTIPQPPPTDRQTITSEMTARRLVPGFVIRAASTSRGEQPNAPEPFVPTPFRNDRSPTGPSLTISPALAFLATRGPVGRRCERSTVKDLRSPSPSRFYIVQPPNMPAIMRTKPEPMVPPAWKFGEISHHVHSDERGQEK